MIHASELEQKLFEKKQQINAASEELAIMVSAFKENQLQIKAQQKTLKGMRVSGFPHLLENLENIVHLEKSWNFAKNNKNHGNIMEFCQSRNVGTLGYYGNDNI